MVLKLKPGDVILMRSEETGLLRKLKDWLLGSQWGHVAIFFDTTKRGLPLLIESIGRGVLIRALNTSEGRYIMVLRHEDSDVALRAAKRAEQIADNPGSWYDYWAIARYVLPRLILYKLTGKRGWLQSYKHNLVYICSELVDASYACIVSGDRQPPLPHDFLYVKELHHFWEGVLRFDNGRRK